MYHGEDITKKISLNEKYYYKRKDEIFRKKIIDVNMDMIIQRIKMNVKLKL